MRFIDQAKLGRGNFGSYMLTIAIVLFAMIVGQIVAEILSQNFLGYSLVQIPVGADFNTILSLLMIQFIAAFGALLLCVKYIHRQPVLSLFTTRDKFDWKRFFLSFSIWGAILGAFLVLSIYLGYPIEWNFNPSTFFQLLAISLFILPLQTSVEEVFFRGYVLQGFGKLVKKAIIPVVITGLLFGLLHGANPEVMILGYGVLIYYIGTGIFLGLLTTLDDGLELGLGYHAMNNIFAALIVTNDWQAFQTDALFIDRSAPVFGWESLLTIFVLQPLLLLLYSKIYKWNWRNLL